MSQTLADAVLDGDSLGPEGPWENRRWRNFLCLSIMMILGGSYLNGTIFDLSFVNLIYVSKQFNSCYRLYLLYAFFRGISHLKDAFFGTSSHWRFAFSLSASVACGFSPNVQLGPAFIQDGWRMVSTKKTSRSKYPACRISSTGSYT